MNAVILFACTFGVVLCLTLQTLNVTKGHQWLAILTSLVISACNLALLKIMPQPTSAIDDLAYLAGGPIGVAVAMAVHPHLVRLIQRRARAQES